MPSYKRKTSDIHISPELNDVLSKMKMSNIAQMILKSRLPLDILVENHVNYLSVSTSDKTKISYLTPERSDQIIKSGEDLWHSSKRIFAKPGAFIKKIFKDVSDKEVELFSTLYRNIQTSPSFKFKIVEGEDIRKYYYYESYVTQDSTLGNSCMKHKSCQPWFQLYVDNPDQIKMLIMVDGTDHILGRALLWMNTIDPNGTSFKVMDRIYTIADEDYLFHFKKWADTYGFIHKKEQKWNNTLRFVSNNQDLDLMRLSAKLNVSDYDRYPYLDTFKFLCRDTNTIFNYKPGFDNIITISGSEGYYEDHKLLTEDGITHMFHYTHEMVKIPSRNFYVHEGRAKYSNIMDVYILEEDGYRHPVLRDWIYKDESLNDMDLINRQVQEYERVRAEQEERNKRILSEREERARVSPTIDEESLCELQGGWTFNGRSSLSEIIREYSNSFENSNGGDTFLSWLRLRSRR